MMYGSSSKVHAWLICRIHGFTPFSPEYQRLSSIVLSIGFATGFLIDMLTYRGFSAWVVSKGKVLPEHLVAAMNNLIAFRDEFRVRVGV